MTPRKSAVWRRVTANALIWNRGSNAQRVLGVLVPAGRMALINYLAVSVLVTAAVSASGTYGSVGLVPSLTIGVGLWVLELIWSTWWLRRRRLGPMEWLWRTASHGRSQPMRPVGAQVQPVKAAALGGRLD